MKTAGILVPPKNSQQLAEAIIYFINHQETAHALTQKAKKIVEKDFSLERMLKQTKKIYTNTLYY